MKKLRITAVLLMLCLLVAAFYPAAAALDYGEYVLPAPNTNASCAIVMELDGGRVLYGKNEKLAADPASLTKIMTVLLVAEAVERGDVSLDDKVPIGNDYMNGIPEDDEGPLKLSPGESLSLRDLMYCAMLVSSNEACNVMAVHVSGSVDGFVTLMNKRAKELGCTDTRFVNTNGLFRPGHYSSASDLAIIAREALGHKLILEICGTREYTVPATETHDARQLQNTNGLINPNSYYGSGFVYSGAFGLKTGHTTQADYCLAGAAEKNGVRILVIVLGCGKSQNFVDTMNLFDWAFNNFSVRKVVEKGETFGKIDVTKSAEVTEVQLVAGKSFRYFLPEGLDVSELQKVVKLDSEAAEAPVKAGEEYGTLTVLGPDGETYGSVPLVAANDVDASVWASLKGEVGGFFSQSWMSLLAIVIVLLILATAVLTLIRRRRRRIEEEKRRRRNAQRRRLENERREKEAHKKYYEDFLGGENGGKKRK